MGVAAQGCWRARSDRMDSVWIMGGMEWMLASLAELDTVSWDLLLIVSAGSLYVAVERGCWRRHLNIWTAGPA